VAPKAQISPTEADWEHAPALELWVDAASKSEGRGTADSPLKTLTAALEVAGPSRRIHLAPGLYRGPFQIAGRVHLKGSKPAVLFAEGMDAVLSSRGPLFLQEVMVQGGRIGIESGSDLRLENVRLSGQRETSIHVLSGMVANETELSATVSETIGVLLAPQGRATLSGCVFRGPYRRAIQLRAGAKVTVADCNFDGPVSGIHLVGGDAKVLRSRFSGGRGPALFAAHGALELLDVDVDGHEYAVQCGEGARLRARRVSSVRAERAGIALTRSNAELEEIAISHSGSFGGIQLVEAEATIAHFWIHRAEAYGVSARGSGLTLRDGIITEVTDREGQSGDGVQLRASRATLESISVLRSAGSGIWAAEDSRVELRDLVLDDCRRGGLVAETLAQVGAVSLMVRGSAGPAIAVPGEARVRVDLLSSEHNQQGAVWAECERGAQVLLTRPKGSDRVPKLTRCVRVEPPAR
jgi:hypothetical protein